MIEPEDGDDDQVPAGAGRAAEIDQPPEVESRSERRLDQSHAEGADRHQQERRYHEEVEPAERGGPLPWIACSELERLAPVQDPDGQADENQGSRQGERLAEGCGQGTGR